MTASRLNPCFNSLQLTPSSDLVILYDLLQVLIQFDHLS